MPGSVFFFRHSRFVTLFWEGRDVIASEGYTISRWFFRGCSIVKYKQESRLFWSRTEFSYRLINNAKSAILCQREWEDMKNVYENIQQQRYLFSFFSLPFFHGLYRSFYFSKMTTFFFFFFFIRYKFEISFYSGISIVWKSIR